MILFYGAKLASMGDKKFEFSKAETLEIQSALRDLKFLSEKFKTYRIVKGDAASQQKGPPRPDLEESKHLEAESEKRTPKLKNSNELKQAFLLNLINFMSLFRLAETALIKPSLLKKLDSFAAWVAFWESTHIYISSCKLSLTEIVNTLLRQRQPIPNFSVVIPDKLAPSQLESEISSLVVKKPHPLNYFGIFIPCAQFQHLQIFDPATLDTQLREAVVRLND